MKRFFLVALSLQLLLLMAGLAGAAALSVNVVGKFTGNVQTVQNQTFAANTPMTVRIFAQSGAVFHGNVYFPNHPEWTGGTPLVFNGALFEGEYFVAGETFLANGKFYVSAPPQILGVFQNIGVETGSAPLMTGVYYLKRVSTNPNAP